MLSNLLLFVGTCVLVFVVYVCLVSDKVQASSTVSTVVTVIHQEGWYSISLFLHFSHFYCNTRLPWLTRVVLEKGPLNGCALGCLVFLHFHSSKS